MAGDSRVLMDHNMEIGVTPAQVNQPDKQISHLCKQIWTIIDKRERKGRRDLNRPNGLAGEIDPRNN